MQISWRKHSSLHNIIFNSFGLLFVLWSMLTKGPNNIDAYNYMDLFIYQQCKKFRFQIFLSAFLWNFLLCQDLWHSDVPQQLAQLCYVALGWALFDILQRSWCIFFSQTHCAVLSNTHISKRKFSTVFSILFYRVSMLKCFILV